MMYSSVAIGRTSQSRLVSPTLFGSYHRPSSSTARLAFQSLEITQEADGMKNSASEESCGCLRRLCAKAVKPSDQTVSTEVSGAAGMSSNELLK